jgi:cyclic pyranopterin monophosphate synthase
MKRNEMPEPERDAAQSGLSHVVRSAGGSRARMVDVGEKAQSVRTALARAAVRFPPGVLGPVLDGGGPKGPIEEVARTAGILAAKRTADLIPLCHPLGLDHVDVVFERDGEDLLVVRCSARCTGRTGVEMEALTGAAVAALTVYDMTKALAKEIRIERVELLEKTGGKGGTWRLSP